MKINLEKATLENKNYRKVLSTTKQSQLVLMNIPAGQEIGAETHRSTTQFIKIEDGHGVAHIAGHRYNLKAGDSVFIPSGTRHNIISTGGLWLYTIYSPPEHPDGLVEKYKE